MLRIMLAGTGLAVASMAVGVQAAGPYPDRPVKVIVPWPAGQATDAATRAVADILSQKLGQPFVVDNRAGAGGAIGSDAAARSTPDGYTLLAGSTGATTINPLITKTNYSASSFKPVGVIATVPYVLVSSSQFPAKDARALIAELRAHPGKYTFASSGSGSIGHLTAELFLASTGVKASHVPYKGSGPALVDVMAGRVDFMFDSVTSILPHLKAGRIHVYGLSSATRSASMPDVPTLAEVTDLKTFDLSAWIGLLAPAGTPDAVVATLNKQLQAVVNTADVKRRYLTIGVETPADTAAASMLKVMGNEQTRLQALIKQANIKVD
ncbi:MULTISPECIES: tripartite tricarboxylate transporter substrate binding protein [unclassified Cupriavidus]|uniref:Bug family tripartite tricarboxylate transporter substrate binding protein n=1 Tax=unclassified Cupriavidus TaxID=2640874 RepID=UPI001BFFDC43|nr:MULTISPECIES: tripartite tricarboxylate transporter substrate binding protein [unclassified Cupriavidus]MCA3186731.1 tripartite tricarboxylate transporter substrate binding protein [Cupriavidus sp.]MCA3189151.1 tripartite tricarboxylate transporter substrate binding protein [Cupriavidus sp.]MCA3198871.1 tripartite tricarboxylate transporter substrate binding protein [Cupriavidus sp.]MCA3201615.1 tripartite tricarboxylate transporter substrate binding protein [Cupriavidus sp.]MCA3233857.1 tr